MRFLICVFLLISVNGFSQWKDFIISVRGDTLNRVDLKGKKQGPWVSSVPDLRGERGYEEQGYYENDLKTGLWKKFSLQGVKIAEENYQWGKLSGRARYYTYNGGLEREENWRAMDPDRKYDTVPVYDINDPDKLINMVVVKNEGYSMKHGDWFYYDPSEGVIIKKEQYQLNKLVTDNGEVVDDELRPIGFSDRKNPSDTSSAKAKLKPKEVMEYEKKNSGKKKVRTRTGSTGM